MQVTQAIKDETALRLVVEGTVSETGVGFFRALVNNLAVVMGTVGAWVTEYLPEPKRFANPAAERFLGCTREDLIGESINDFLVPESAARVEAFAREIGGRPEGRFSVAHGGTIFLDEAGELPLELQAKLLRVRQEGEFEPLGGAKSVKVDVRIVAATNRDLKRMCAEGKFREDLYFRLHVFPVHIPPLRERGRDLELLTAAFIQRFARRMGKRIHPLTDDQFKRLRSYDWPGNVRELQNVIERAIILTSGNQLELERAMGGIAAPAPNVSLASMEQTTRVFTVREMGDLECENIRRALESCGGKVSGESGAARLLGIPATTLNSRMKALKIERPKD